MRNRVLPSLLLLVALGCTPDEPHGADIASLRMTTCNDNDRQTYQAWGEQIHFDAIVSSGPIVGGVPITLHGSGFDLIPPEAELRITVFGPVSGRPGVLEPIFRGAATSRSINPPRTRRIVVLPSGAPAGPAELALVVGDECVVASAGNVVKRRTELTLASYRPLQVGAPLPAPSTVPAAVAGLRASPQGPSSAFLTWSDAGGAFGYRVALREIQVSGHGDVAVLPRDQTQFVLHGLKSSTTYEAAVFAFNPVGEARPATVTFTTTRDRNEGGFVRVTILDTSLTQVPFGPSLTDGDSFLAEAGVAYYDDEKDEVLADQPATSPNGPFPHFFEGIAPTSAHPHAWIVRDGNRYDRDQAGPANTIVFAEFPPTAFARAERQFVAAHLRIEEDGSVRPLIVTAGDLDRIDGRIMFSTYALVTATASLPGSPEPWIDGSIDVNLEFIETYSTTEGIDYFHHQTVARIDFSISVIED